MKRLVAAASPLPDSRMVREMSHGVVIEIGDFRLVVTHWIYYPIPWRRWTSEADQQRQCDMRITS